MKTIRGIGASPGIAIGPAYRFHRVDLHVDTRSVHDVDAEFARFYQALEHAEGQLRLVHEKARREAGAEQAAIFEAQLEMLRDPELLGETQAAIRDQRLNAEAAWWSTVERFAAILEEMESEYFRARAADIRDVGRRVLRILKGITEEPMQLTEPVVILAQDLSPSDTVGLDKSLVLGFCTAGGGETSHTAILARSLGLPAVVAAGPEVLQIPSGTQVILDGVEGLLIVEPDEQVAKVFVQRREALTKLREQAFAHCKEPAVTLDGHRVEVVANIGNVQGAFTALEHGAEGVGLLRTEFLYLERSTLPDEEEQYQAYRAILEVFGQQPVVLRTLDIGGDKELAYMELPKEENPFLGVRGIRLCLVHPELFYPQIRAALRAGVGYNLKLMFPMIATLDEVRAAKRIVEACREELRRDGKPVADNIEIGIMVEVPSAAVMAEHFAREVDFFSIGTNDLTQYTLAADRANAQLADLISAFSPAVLILIDQVIQAAHRHGKWVGLCGELAGEPLGIPILLGLGLDEFSMNPSAIPLAKQIIRSLSLTQCQELAREVLTLESAQAVKERVRERFPFLTLS